MKRGRNQIPKKGGAEWDCFTNWRKLLCYMQRPGAKASIRRGYNKRARALAKRESQSLGTSE